MKRVITAALLLSCSTACSDPNFRAVSADLLSRTGYITQAEANNMLEAGGRAAESQEELTPEQEYYLGRAVAAKILARYPLEQNAALHRYVNQVGQTVVAVSDAPETFNGYHFAVVRSPEVNAMAAPGGFIFVTSGFLKRLPDEDALAAVLAHEVAHVVKGHGVNAISNANLFAALGSLAAEGTKAAGSRIASPVSLNEVTELFSDSVSNVVDKLLTSGYDRGHEYEADAYAAELLRRSGYGEESLVEVLRLLESAQGSGDAGWFATHPEPADRIDELPTARASGSNAAAEKVRLARFRQATRSL